MNAKVKGLEIPKRSRNDTWVQRVRPGERLKVVILSEVLWGMHCHWTGARSVECTKAEKACVGCERQLPTRWKGGLHVWDLGRRESYFVEITPRAARRIVEQTENRSTLRGVCIELSRSGTKVNGRLVVQIVDMSIDMKRLPAGQAVSPALQWLWSR